MNRKLTTLAVAAAAGVVTAAAVAASPVAITETAIQGARIGLRSAAYEQLLGKPATSSKPQQPEGWTKIAFPKRQMSVYFPGAKAAVITTWNRSYRTAAGIHPCSTIAQLKKAYGKQLKPSPFNTQHGVVYAYTVGKNLLFATNSLTQVDVVALYDGSAPGAQGHGRTLAYAGFVALSETPCI